jgi:hypothetical protein
VVVERMKKMMEVVDKFELKNFVLTLMMLTGGEGVLEIFQEMFLS